MQLYVAGNLHYTSQPRSYAYVQIGPIAPCQNAKTVKRVAKNQTKDEKT